MVKINDDPAQHNEVSESTSRDYTVQAYQDELDTDQSKTDPLMNELNDDPVELLGVPASELRDELDKRDLDSPAITDDMRSEIEDLDDGMGARD